MTATGALAAAWLLVSVGSATGVEAPSHPPIVNVCWDYGCDRNERLILPAADWRRIATLMRPAAPSPRAERDRVARAIALFETAVGRRTGTTADLKGNYAGSGRPGQQDCIDESRNTTGYMRVLEEYGFLRWHRVGERRRRAKWILDQHWTAVLIERETGHSWAIDSWFLDNGKRPYVQRLPAWLDKAEPPPNPDA